ncbi:MAG: winged helix-turn-helix transcriptional regulator [Eggerthella lenta]
MAPGKRARYSELRKSIPYDISHKMFSQHLSELEQVGIIERVVVEVKPLRVDYLLTEKGISFANVLYFIRDWGAAYGGFSAETLQRTKGTMGEGVLVYGSADDGSEQGAAERITWQFDPSTFDVRGSAGRRYGRSVIRLSKQGKAFNSFSACRPPCGLSSFSDCPSACFQVRSALISALLLATLRQQNAVGTASRSDLRQAKVRFKKDDRHDFENQLAQTERGAVCWSSLRI